MRTGTPVAGSTAAAGSGSGHPPRRARGSHRLRPTVRWRVPLLLAATGIAVAACVVALAVAGGPGAPAPEPVTHETPSAPVPGWELTAPTTGLGSSGASCAGLPAYTGPGRPAAGATIAHRRIDVPLDLSNGGITISDSCVRPRSVGAGMPILTTTHFDGCTGDVCPWAPTPVTIVRSEIDGSLLDPRSAAFTTAFEGVGDLRGNYVHDVGSGIALVNTGWTASARVEGNYVTHLRAWGDAARDGNHSDAFTIRDFATSRSPGRTVVVSGNRFDCRSGNDTAAVFLQTWAGDIGTLTLSRNLLEGNGYQLGLEQGFGHGYGGLVAVDNRFSGTGYGPAYVQGGQGWARWSDNYLDDPARSDDRGKPLGPP